VARNDRQFRVWQFAVDDMQIRAANPACRDFDADFACTRRAIGQLRPFERLAGPFEHHGMHSDISPSYASKQIKPGMDSDAADHSTNSMEDSSSRAHCGSTLQTPDSSG
jgi:hypothetical protein